MKKTMRFFSLLLTFCIFTGLFSFNVSAKTTSTYPIDCGVYVIEHVESGKCWDITDESNSNGARLQL